MANTTQYNIKCLGTPEVVYFKEGASQSFLAGDIVVLTSGLVVAAATDGTAALGVAMKAASNTTASTTDNMPVALFRNCTWEVNTYEASSPGTKYVQTIVGDGNDYELVVSSNKAYLDLDAHTNSFFKIVGDLVDAAGTGYGRVHVVVCEKADQSGNYTA